MAGKPWLPVNGAVNFGVALRPVFFLMLIMLTAAVNGQQPNAHVDDPLVDVTANTELQEAMKSLDKVLDEEPIKRPNQNLRNRIIAFGLMGGALLALMGVFFAYLRMDHATRGFYSGRLQSLAAVVAILILVASYFLWTQLLFK